MDAAGSVVTAPADSIHHARGSGANAKNMENTKAHNNIMNIYKHKKSNILRHHRKNTNKWTY